MIVNSICAHCTRYLIPELATALQQGLLMLQSDLGRLVGTGHHPRAEDGEGSKEDPVRHYLHHLDTDVQPCIGGGEGFVCTTMTKTQLHIIKLAGFQNKLRVLRYITDYSQPQKLKLERKVGCPNRISNVLIRPSTDATHSDTAVVCTCSTTTWNSHKGRAETMKALP